MTRGVPTTEHWRVGRDHEVLNWTPFPPLVNMRKQAAVEPGSVGRCVSVTPWGNHRIRWVRLVFVGGREKSYAPSRLNVLT